MKTLVLLAVSVASGLAAPAFAGRPNITRDIPYSNSDDLQLSFDLCQPESANGAAVLYIVSGGWYSPRFDPTFLFPARGNGKNLFAKLTDAGFTVVFIRHRSAPKYKVPDAVSDVRRATRYLRCHAEEYGLDPNRFGAVGASAGGHLSLMLGTSETDNAIDELAAEELNDVSDRVQAVVAYYPPTDLRLILAARKQFPALDFDPALAKSVSPLAFVTSDDAPTLLVHGTADRIVPLVSSQAIYLAMRAAKVPADLIVLENAGHGFRGDDASAADAATLKWFQSRLTVDSP